MTPPIDADAELFGRYLDLDEETFDVLRALRDVVLPHLDGITRPFYERVRRHPEALARFPGGVEQLARQEESLRGWLIGIFEAAMDVPYIESLRRVGSVHVNSGVDEALMIAASNWIRHDFARLLSQVELPEGITVARAMTAVGKLVDFGLGIMLTAYWGDLQARLTRVDRLALIGKFTATINHELRNPLGVIGTSRYILEKKLKDTHPDVKQHLEKIGRSLERANAIISGMLRLMKVSEPKRNRVDVGAFLTETVAHMDVPENVKIEIEGRGDPPWGTFDEDQVRQAVENLVRNACEVLAPRGGGRVRIEWRCDPLGTAVTVRDDGPGIPAELRHRIFEPLFSTKSVGTGLGLTLTKAVVESHGGIFDVAEGLDGRGVGFEVRLPHVVGPPLQRPESADEPAP